MDSALSFRGLFREVSKYPRKCDVVWREQEVCSRHFSGFPSVSAKGILVVKKVESEG